MKSFIFFAIILISLKGLGQLPSGTPVIHSRPQPVPNSTTTEKSAPPQPVIIPPTANPVPPVYPGAESKAVVIPRQLINPPVTPSGTQPIQKEPLSPVESTNNLQPNRPARDRASRVNNATAVSPIVSNSPVVSNRIIATSNNNYTSNKKAVTYKQVPKVNTNKKSASVKAFASKKPITKKKPR